MLDRSSDSFHIVDASNVIDSPPHLRRCTSIASLPVSYRATYWCTAALFVALAIYSTVAVAMPAPEATNDRLAMFVICAGIFALGVASASRATISYSFSDRAIERQSPFPYLSKTVASDPRRQNRGEVLMVNRRKSS